MVTKFGKYQKTAAYYKVGAARRPQQNDTSNFGKAKV